MEWDKTDKYSVNKEGSNQILHRECVFLFTHKIHLCFVSYEYINNIQSIEILY